MINSLLIDHFTTKRLHCNQYLTNLKNVTIIFKEKAKKIVSTQKITLYYFLKKIYLRKKNYLLNYIYAHQN